jgi:hypothetical protein
VIGLLRSAGSDPVMVTAAAKMAPPLPPATFAQ